MVVFTSTFSVLDVLDAHSPNLGSKASRQDEILLQFLPW